MAKSASTTAESTSSPGLKVLGEIAAFLGAGLDATEILAGVAGALRRGLDLPSCCIWIRTREIDAQRRFTAKIIDSLPVGLYAIDKDYRIQAWNRKRETGTQGVTRDEALGRVVFEVLHRQPRALLQDEFDSVFSTGKMEQ